MIEKIFIGWDAREDLAYQVCRHSLQKRSPNISGRIVKLNLDKLIEQGYYSRTFSLNSDGQKIDDIDKRPFSTDFSFSRFLVPELMGHKGWAIFVDCDFLFLSDISQLEKYLDPKYAAICVHHNYQPNENLKMDGVRQEKYFRKNWSSFVIWNCSHPSNRALTSSVVNSQMGSWLHKFGWLSDGEIGRIPEEWNWLEGHSDISIKPKAIHYTRGGPWFENYRNVQYADLWLKELDSLNSAANEIQF